MTPRDVPDVLVSVFEQFADAGLGVNILNDAEAPDTLRIRVFGLKLCPEYHVYVAEDGMCPTCHPKQPTPEVTSEPVPG